MTGARASADMVQATDGTSSPEQFDGLVQERRNSSALAMELRLSYTNPSGWYYVTFRYQFAGYIVQMVGYV